VVETAIAASTVPKTEMNRLKMPQKIGWMCHGLTPVRRRKAHVRVKFRAPKITPIASRVGVSRTKGITATGPSVGAPGPVRREAPGAARPRRSGGPTGAAR